jgi:RNA polymerase sigma factor (sigma-70 family)
MSLESEKIQLALEEAINALAESRDVGKIKPILYANLDRGRIQAYTEGKTDQVFAYVWLVAETFASLNPLLHSLQAEKSTEAWAPLFERMQNWAYSFFLKKGFAADKATSDIASECSTEAAVSLISAYFPYDTEFDAWAHIIVQNSCRKFMEKAFRKSIVPQENIVELDDNLISAEELLLEMQTLRSEQETEIAHALAQLSEARRNVIHYIYFDELDAEEAAQKMGKTVGAIYSLQFNALQDLRKILSTIRDNINE